MTDSSNENIEKRKRRIIAKLLAILWLLLIVFTASTILFFEASWFRKPILQSIIAIVNSELKGKIELKDIHFYTVDGVMLSEPRVLAGKDTVFAAEKIYLNVSVMTFFSNKIKINKVYIKNAHISLLRNMRGEWNIANIAYPSTTPKTESKSKFQLKELIIEGSYFKMYDSTKAVKDNSSIDYSHAIYSGLELRASAEYGPKFIKAEILKLQGTELNSGFFMKDFCGIFTLNDSTIKVENARIRTEKTDIELDAEYKFSVFQTDSLIVDDKYLFADIKFNKFDFSDVKKIAPIKNFDLFRNTEGEIKARGTLNNLYVYYCNVTNGDIDISLKNVRLKNLMNPKDFTYKGNIDANAEQSQLPKIFKFMDFSKLPYLGRIKIDKSYVFGTVDSVFTVLNVKSTNGDFGLRAGLCYMPVSNYFMKLDVKKLNVNSILKKTNISNNLNFTLDLKGSDINYKKLTSELNLKCTESEINNVQIKDANIHINSVAGNYTIDTLNINALSKNGTGTMHFNLIGNLAFMEHNQAIYNFTGKYNNMDMAYLSNVSGMPNILSGGINIQGKGLNIDSMVTKALLNFDEVSFSDKSLFPFDVSMELGDLSAGGRFAKVNSDFVDLNLTGNYKLSELSEHISDFTKELGKSFANYSDKLLPGANKPIRTVTKYKSFPLLNCSVSADLKDIAAFSTFWKGSEIDMDARIKIDIATSHERSDIKISELTVDNLRFDNKKNHFDIKNINMVSNTGFVYKDSILSLESMNFRLRIPDKIKFNKEELYFPYLNLDISDKQIDLSTAIGYWDKIALNFKTSFTVTENSLLMKADSFRIDFRNGFMLQNVNPIVAEATNEKIVLSECSFAGTGGSRLDLQGTLRDSVLENITVELRDFGILNLNKFYPESSKEMLEKIDLTIDKLLLTCNGTFNNPKLKLDVNTKEVSFDKIPFGKMHLYAGYSKELIFGGVTVYTKPEEPRLDIRLNKLNFVDDKPEYNVDVIADSFALDPLAVFIEPLFALRAALKCNINLTSTQAEGAVLKGDLAIENAYFHLKSTNLKYRTNIKLLFEDKIISIDKIDIANYDTKGTLGYANLKGFVYYDKKLNLDSINVDLTARKFKILGSETKETIQTFYGDVVISTDPIINVSGEFDKLRFKGGLALNQADINIPLLSGGKNAESKLEYEYLNENTAPKPRPKVITEAMRDSMQKAKVAKIDKKKKNIFRNFDIDVTFDIAGKESISMDLGPLGEIYAEINERDNKKMSYLKRPGDEYGQINGSIVLSDKSKLNTFKILNVSGNIEFPTGSPLEPQVDIQARYKGITTIGTIRKDYEVVIELWGPPKNLQTNIYYLLEGDRASGDKSEIQEKALYLLLTGQFKSTSTMDSQGQGPNLIAEGGSALVSAFASKTLTDLLATGFISNAGIDFKGSSFEEPTIKFQGQLPGDITWSFGGDLANLNGSREIIIEVPLRSLLNKNYFKNVFLKASWNELSHKTEINNEDTDWQIMINFNKSW
ncbi:MAG: hypothetical protein WCR42_02555 [bacterium]